MPGILWVQTIVVYLPTIVTDIQDFLPPGIVEDHVTPFGDQRDLAWISELINGGGLETLLTNNYYLRDAIMMQNGTTHYVGVGGGTGKHETYYRILDYLDRENRPYFDNEMLRPTTAKRLGSRGMVMTGRELDVISDLKWHTDTPTDFVRSVLTNAEIINMSRVLRNALGDKPFPQWAVTTKHPLLGLQTSLLSLDAGEDVESVFLEKLIQLTSRDLTIDELLNLTTDAIADLIDAEQVLELMERRTLEKWPYGRPGILNIPVPLTFITCTPLYYILTREGHHELDSSTSMPLRKDKRPFPLGVCDAVEFSDALRIKRVDARQFKGWLPREVVACRVMDAAVMKVIPNIFRPLPFSLNPWFAEYNAECVIDTVRREVKKARR